MFTDVHDTIVTSDDVPDAVLTSPGAHATVVNSREHRQASEAEMALRFIGIDPNTGTGESPTVWVDQEKREFVFQGWKPDAATTAECAAFEVPGHAVGIPDHEAVIRIPASMVDMIRKACDVLDSAVVR
jgi:hypothetical protein